MNTDGSGYTLEWVGITHYKKAITEHAWFNQELMNSFWRLVYNVPLVIAFSFFIRSPDTAISTAVASRLFSSLTASK